MAENAYVARIGEIFAKELLAENITRKVGVFDGFNQLSFGFYWAESVQFHLRHLKHSKFNVQSLIIVSHP